MLKFWLYSLVQSCQLSRIFEKSTTLPLHGVSADVKLTQPDDLERTTGRGIAATKGGTIKSRHLDQIRIGPNTGRLDAFKPAQSQTAISRDRRAFLAHLPFATPSNWRGLATENHMRKITLLQLRTFWYCHGSYFFRLDIRFND